MYFPLSQITSNLYTNGNEFATKLNNSPYTGYYWKTSTGKYYTGKTPQDTPTEELISFSVEGGSRQSNVINTYYNDNDDIAANYLNLVDPPPPNAIPTYFATLPTPQDYQNTEFRRYFCKKTNEIIYLEISKETYDKLLAKDPKTLFELYVPFNLPWQLTGDREQVYKTNINITELTSVRQKLPMLAEYLKMNFTKYYK
jgi:hypothetical protein